MQRLLFYCQHILGMGHLVRSMEIVRGLVKDFQVCFINGGEIVDNFAIPPEVEVINLPAIKIGAEFRSLQAVDSGFELTEIQQIRRSLLLKVFEQFQPDILMIELFPFGRRKFSFELIPLLEQVQAMGCRTKVVCSLRDIVVTKTDQQKHEEKVCNLINRYFDLLLVHGDPQFQRLEEMFSRVGDLACPIYYTGYVVQPQPEISLDVPQPLILASIGGGRFGHELLDTVIDAAPLLQKAIPHQIQVFTGPFMPADKFAQLQSRAENCPNLRLDRFTPNLPAYMQKADLSISMSGYNTTLNVLTTGVRAMLLPFTGNDDQEQLIRAEKLEKLGAVQMIQQEELQGDRLAQKILNCLQKQPHRLWFDFNGVETTSVLLKQLIDQKKATELHFSSTLNRDFSKTAIALSAACQLQ